MIKMSIYLLITLQTHFYSLKYALIFIKIHKKLQKSFIFKSSLKTSDIKKWTKKNAKKSFPLSMFNVNVHPSMSIPTCHILSTYLTYHLPGTKIVSCCKNSIDSPDRPALWHDKTERRYLLLLSTQHNKNTTRTNAQYGITRYCRVKQCGKLKTQNSPQC